MAEDIKHSPVYDDDSSEEPSGQSLPDLTRRLAHSLQKPFNCQTCSKKFASKKALSDHMRAHSGEKPFQCNMCGKLFLRSGDLKRHIMMHSGEKPYQCEICQKQFPRKGNLQLHRITHTKAKPHQCVLCERFFAQKSGLTQHMLTHSGVKKFQCERCQKEFARKAYLQKHMLSHRNVPLDCEVCGKSFTASRNLKLHALSHVAHKLYRCHLCEEVYTQKIAYYKHLITHNERLECQVCFREFKSAFTLEKHVRTHSAPAEKVNGFKGGRLKITSQELENSNSCAAESDDIPANVPMDTQDMSKVPTADEHSNVQIGSNENGNVLINIYDMKEEPWTDGNNIQVVVIESTNDMSIDFQDPSLQISQNDDKNSNFYPVIVQTVSLNNEQFKAFPIMKDKVSQIRGHN